MDNRRPPTANNSPRPLNRSDNFRNESDRPAARRFEPRDNRSQPGRDRFQTRDSQPPRPNDNRFPARDNRQPPRDERTQPPTRTGGRFQPRDEKFQPRDSNSPARDNKFQPRDGKFQPRDHKPAAGGRFAPKGKPVKPWEREQQQIRIVSDMQVTDGKHRGKYLETTASERVRPTARRIREVMFRILYRRIRAGRFLDLCAGSGAVGIEAISRGALIGTFVERSAKMCGHIKKNLAACDIKEGHGEICEIEAVPFLKRMEKRRRFWDVVYFDPPYDYNYDEVLDFFSRGTIIRTGGVLIIEHHVEMFFPEEIGAIKRWRVVTQGETSLSFYERR